MPHHSFPRRAAAALAAVALAAVLLPAVAKDAPPVVPVGADFNAAAVAADAFESPDTQALKGMKRAAVTVFVVEFVTADAVHAQTSGFGAAGRASSSLYYRLQGVGQPDFQALAERMHADFLQRLAASGVEVVPTETLLASPVYRGFRERGGPLPSVSDDKVVVGPSGLGLFGVARMAPPAKGQRGLLDAFSAIGDGFSAASDVISMHELSSALGATLLEVRLRVNFVELTNHNRGFWGRMANSASTSGKVGPSVEGMLVGVQAGQQRATLTGKPTLALDPAAFAQVREKPATAGDVAGAVLVGLIKLASKSNDSDSRQEMEAIAEPTQYRAVVGDGLARVSELLVARLAAGR
jgi:hypothetical protein